MKKSYFILHLAVLLAGFTGVFGKLISLHAFPLVWFRIFFTVFILAIIVQLFKIRRLSSWRDIFLIAQPGILITIHWVFFYASIKYSNISIGAVCYCLTSFFTAIFEPLINKKRFEISQLLLSLMTLVGISLIFHFDANYKLGILLGVISSAFAALYTIFNERLVQKYNSILINYYQMIGGLLMLSLFFPVVFLIDPEMGVFPAWDDTLLLIALALFCTVGLYVMFAEVLKKLSAFTVNLSFNLEPIYAIAMAFLFFNEGQEVNISFYFGLAFVMMSVLLQTVLSMRKSK